MTLWLQQSGETALKDLQDRRGSQAATIARRQMVINEFSYIGEKDINVYLIGVGEETKKVDLTHSPSTRQISQLTSLDPRGSTRRPPPAVIEQLRTLNATLRLGHLLCRSRQPNFLLQGAAQTKPWLADLVESNEGAWNVLPVQCLCEFLLHEAADGLPVNDLMNDCKQQLGKRKERRHKHQQLVQHLRLLLTDPNQLP
ncbi:hypothetical protein DAPPUDRAFT_306111 [Daphnia pulex]|uniref:Uncharacterized protein n=1 Tax=Daphnia pulex TaxID=6669 RepID=E9GV12_DAPPU|nr:hypothetical protein DAPPUDRAFT_306111 [Daphnia pulex]|eukprot:EFX76696.1 hypothetical protein DAPPUDRAFT_306111 [Daphnia pulex]